jgi:hypothetical protein
MNLLARGRKIAKKEQNFFLIHLLEAEVGYDF